MSIAHRRTRVPWPALLAAGILAAVVSGCGAAPSTKTGGVQRNAGAYAACTRSHGIPDFPDANNGGFNENDTPTTTTVNGVTLKESAAQLQTADQACQHYLGESQGDGAPSPQQQQAAEAFAQCMRAHGFPDFPDPSFAHGVMFNTPPDFDPRSPQVQAAQTACQSTMPRAGSD
jgi:hypothetical protein